VDVSLHLQQRLDTKLALTPQLKQSLDILKYSLEELEHFIREEANANPLIELKEEQNTLLEMAHVSTISDSRTEMTESFNLLLHVSDMDDSIETYLREQLIDLKELTQREKEILLYLIRNLNELGYLDHDIEDTADRYSISVEKCEELISVLQSLEPAGIGARNLAECLYLQAIRAGDAPKLAKVLIHDHLEDLAEGNVKKLATLYHVTNSEVEEAFSYIKQLNPRPLNIQSTKQQVIIPDILVELIGGEIVIQINDMFLPQISINSYYEEFLRTNASGEVQEYLKVKLSDAFLLMRGIKQRHKTLYRVTEIVLQKQFCFLQKGKNALVPLRQREVAEIMQLHESTISRTISNKYIQTPQGTFPLKMFFTRGVKNQSDKEESPFFIKGKIKAIIEMEDKNNPLSDQKIANILLSEGIPIARRTIAKYREELGILQSTKRRVRK